jgi:assimilatory nitrate reductase catalytic subunit
MTRSGQSPRLGAHLPEPYVEVHPDDAEAAGLHHDGFARVASPYGACVLKVVVSAGQRRGSLFAPIHWSDETASSARVGELVTPATDPFSGQPEAKATPASIEPVEYAFRGFALARERIPVPSDVWWSRLAVENGSGLLLAGNLSPAAWREQEERIFGHVTSKAEYIDEMRGHYRMAVFDGDRLAGCLFVGPAATAPRWDAMKTLFAGGTVSDVQRRTMLSGKSADGLSDPGPIICACFGVGLTVIRNAILSGAATTVEDVGAALRAGTNCGSCLPELRRILA